MILSCALENTRNILVPGFAATAPDLGHEDKAVCGKLRDCILCRNLFTICSERASAGLG